MKNSYNLKLRNIEYLVISFNTIFLLTMSGIPIVVSRLTNSGKKEVYTVRDSINKNNDSTK